MSQIGDIIRLLAAQREELSDLQGQVKAQEAIILKTKLALMDELGKVGLKEGRNDTHSASITEKTLPQVVDWDEFYKYIHANKFYHLLQRRPSTTGCEELFALGEIPGVVRFKKVDISLRSL